MSPAAARLFVNLACILCDDKAALAPYLAEKADELTPPEPEHPFLVALGQWSRKTQGGRR
jgi:hypothetical protein